MENLFETLFAWEKINSNLWQEIIDNDHNVKSYLIG
jgi:hypothetical protein